MKYMLVAVLALVFAGPVAFAQGSGSDEGNVASNDTFQVTRSFEGKVMQMKLEDHALVVADRDGEHHTFHLDKETAITSSKEPVDSEILDARDVKPGQRVKIVFRPSDMYAVKLRVLN